MDLATAFRRCEAVIAELRKQAFLPEEEKTLRRRFNRPELAEYVDRNANYIARLEKQLIADGVLSELADQGQFKYEVKHIHELQAHFDTRPWRDPNLDDPLVMAVSSLKGGVGKTTVAIYTAQYLATKGYRVLVIDMDNQASATAVFGINPDRDLSPEETVLPYFEGGEETLDYAIRKTYFPGLDLVPTNLTAFNIEWSLAAELVRAETDIEKDELTSLLRSGIDSVSENYDVVIIDSPPNLGTTTMNVLRAADAILVPSPARSLDFESTVTFLRMIIEHSGKLGIDRDYKFLKLACTLYEGRMYGDTPSSQKYLQDVMGVALEEYLVPQPFHKLAEVENSAASQSTVFEDYRPQKKARDQIERFCREIEYNILATWPSKAKEAFELRTSLDEAAAADQKADDAAA